MVACGILKARLERDRQEIFARNTSVVKPNYTLLKNPHACRAWPAKTELYFFNVFNQ